MTDTALDTAQSLMQEFEKDLYYLHDQRPTVTRERRHITYYSYYTDQGEVAYESYAGYADLYYRKIQKSLLKQSIRYRSTAPDREMYNIVKTRLHHHEQYGIQEHQGMQEVFAVEYQQSKDSRVTRLVMHDYSLRSLLRVAYRRLVGIENTLSERFGYKTMQALMEHNAVHRVLQHHTIEAFSQYIDEIFPDLEPHFRDAVTTAENTALQQCQILVKRFSAFPVAEFYHHYQKRLVTEYILQIFTQLSPEEQEYPLSWSIVPRFDDIACIAFVRDKLQRSTHLAVEAAQKEKEAREREAQEKKR